MKLIFERTEDFTDQEKVYIQDYIQNAFIHLHQELNLSPNFLSLNKQLTIITYEVSRDLEMVERNSNAMATSQFLIKLRGFDGLTCIFHEWFHLLDYLLAGSRPSYYLSELMWDTPNEELNQLADIQSAMWKLVQKIKSSSYYNRIANIGNNKQNKDYELKPVEILARLFESYMKDKLGYSGTKFENINMESPFYPTTEESKYFLEDFDTLFINIAYVDSLLFPKAFSINNYQR